MYQRAIKEIRTYPPKAQQQEPSILELRSMHLALSVPYRPFSNHLFSRRCLHNPECHAHISSSTNWLSKSVPPCPSSSYSRATARYSHDSPGTRKTKTSFRSSTLTPPRSSAELPAHSRSLPSSPSTPSSVRSKAWFHEVIDNASRTVQVGEATVASPVAPRRNLRSSTKEQRKAQPLWKAKLPSDFSEFNSPTSSKERKKSSPTL